MRADQLQADGQATRETTRQRHRRQPREVRADGVDVVEVHGDRVVALGADGERGRGRGRPKQQVAVRESPGEIGADELSHALGLEVIGVEVAGRQHIGAGHDPALDLGAEALTARARVEVCEVPRGVAAMTEAHTVEAREVRGALGGCDDVVGGHGQWQVRAADLTDLDAETLVDRDRLANPLLAAAVEALVEELAHHADGETREGVTEGGHVIGHGGIGAGRVARIETRHRTEQQRRVLGADGDEPRLIEARSEGDHAVAAGATVGRLDAGHTAERSGLTDGAPGIGGRGSRHETGCYGRRGAAGGAAGHQRWIPRVAHRPEEARLVRRAHRELVHVQLAEHHRARRLEADDDRGVVRGHEIRKHLRAAGGAHPLGAEDVLVGDRHAGQRARPAGGPSVIGGLRGGQGALGGDRDEGVEGGLAGSDAIEAGPGEFDARVFPAEQPAGEPGYGRRGQWRQGAHSITFGTRYRPASAAGALRW